MSLLGNLIWLLFGGFVSSLAYIVGGALCCLTIIGIPFGLQAIKLGIATFAPFGKELRRSDAKGSVLKALFDAIWLVFFGWEIALSHLFHAIILAITIIGIPFAKQHLKLIPVSLLPFSYELH